MKKKLKALKKPVRAAAKPTPLRAPVRPERDTSDAQRMALAAAAAALDKKAMGVEIIDVAGKVDYADYLVLMTGHADRTSRPSPMLSTKRSASKAGTRFRSKACRAANGC